MQLFGLVRQFCHRLALFLDLILQYVQVFGITALYTALEVGESRLPHVLEELGLQQAVRAHQPGLAVLFQHRLALFIGHGDHWPLFAVAHLHDRFPHGTPQRRVFAPLGPSDLLFHHRQVDNVEVIVEHIPSQSVTGFPVALVGVHDRRDDILLPASNFLGQLVHLGVELLGVFIAAVGLEIVGIHVKHQLIKDVGIRFQTSGGNDAFLHHPVKLLGVSSCLAGLEGHIVVAVFQQHIRVGVHFVLAFVVPFPHRDSIFTVALIAHHGPMNFADRRLLSWVRFCCGWGTQMLWKASDPL